MTIEEFLLARISDIEQSEKMRGLPQDLWMQIHILCEMQKAAIDWHKKWPVVVESPLKFEILNDGELLDNTFKMQMTQQINWITQQEYRQRFGDEPPTAPILRVWAMNFHKHPDFDNSWMF